MGDAAFGMTGLILKPPSAAHSTLTIVLNNNFMAAETHAMSVMNVMAP
jgi:hypothetical protein